MWRQMTPVMEDYRIYRLDGVGMIAPAELIAASDDNDAIRQVRAIGRDARKCELWKGKRLVIALDGRELEDES